MCTEPTEQKLSAVFMGVSSWGFGGTNAGAPRIFWKGLREVHMHCYGGVDEVCHCRLRDTEGIEWLSSA